MLLFVQSTQVLTFQQLSRHARVNVRPLLGGGRRKGVGSHGLLVADRLEIICKGIQVDSMYLLVRTRTQVFNGKRTA